MNIKRQTHTYPCSRWTSMNLARNEQKLWAQERTPCDTHTATHTHTHTHTYTHTHTTHTQRHTAFTWCRACIIQCRQVNNQWRLDYTRIIWNRIAFVFAQIKKNSIFFCSFFFLFCSALRFEIVITRFERNLSPHSREWHVTPWNLSRAPGTADRARSWIETKARSCRAATRLAYD